MEYKAVTKEAMIMELKVILLSTTKERILEYYYALVQFLWKILKLEIFNVISISLVSEVLNLE